MKIAQYKFSNSAWSPNLSGDLLNKANFALVFASSDLLEKGEILPQIVTKFPNAIISGCSTSGEIHDTEVLDESVIVSAFHLENTKVELAKVSVSTNSNSYELGKNLATQLLRGNDLHDGDLCHVIVFSNGLCVNGSELVCGLSSVLPSNVSVTGGLAGDGARFEKTFVIANDVCDSSSIVAVGFYGSHLKVSYGSFGGWDSFGPERIITKSRGNVLYELDGKSALELYKTYLGEHASGLPATGLLFPLSIRVDSNEDRVVRTILGIDDTDRSMTFAGDVPNGSLAQFMKANFDRLIDGATKAAETTLQNKSMHEPEFALLISCVGRKMVLKQRVEEEVETVKDVLGNQVVLAGFYSYGEISPFAPNAKCALHNQTMTITTFKEIL